MDTTVRAHISSSTLFGLLRMQLAHSNDATRRCCTHRARLGGWYVRRGPRGPQLPPRAARRKVSSRRDSPLPAPNQPSPGAAAAHSWRPPRVAGTTARLATAGGGTGATAYLSGLAATASGAATDLSASYHSCPMWCARCDRARLHTHVYGRSRRRAASQPPPRHPYPALASPSSHPVPLGSLPQVSVPTRRRHHAPAASHGAGPGASITLVTDVTDVTRVCQPPARAPARGAVRVMCAGRAGT